MYYFGCGNQAGHYLFSKDGRSFVREESAGFPFKWHMLDGAMLPPNLPDVQGRASLIHFPGWTVLTFWDRSVDTRGGCNSSFITKGHLTFSEICEQSKQVFPWVWSRMKFEVVEWKPG